MTLPLVPTYIPIKDAAKKYGYTLDDLKRLAQSGKIKAVKLPDGDMIVSEDSVKEKTHKEDLPEYKEFIELKGTGLGLRESAEKYNVPVSTLRGWVTKKIISVIGTEGRKTLLDQADVAYCAKIYRAIGRQGRRIFNLDGTPYKPKTGPLAEPKIIPFAG
jgi:predicted site-specific integrase-resolvase